MSLPLQSGQFTTTHWSVIVRAAGDDSTHAAAALETLCRTYWYPLYAYVRRQSYTPEDAQDLIQSYFERLLAKDYLSQVDREKGRFRSFLLASLNHFLSNERDRARAAKRGGGNVPISLDQETAEGLFVSEPASDLSPEKLFERRWATTLLEQAFARLEKEMAAPGKQASFDALKGFIADTAGSGDYHEISARTGRSPNAVAAAVRRLRVRYRELVREEIAHTVAAPHEIDEEMRHLFSVLSAN